MKSEKALWTSVSILIGAVIAVLAFVRGDAQLWLLLGVFALWGIWVIGFLCMPLIKQVKKNLKQKALLKARYSEVKGNTPHKHASSVEADLATQQLLRHVNLRITGYIRSIYRDASWEWCEKAPERLVLNGGTGRIRVCGIADFDHADVTIDTMGEITCSMVKSVPLEKLNASSNSDEPLPPNQQPVNTQVWFELQGRKILEKTIADLNSRGYSTLTIREDGDVLIDQGEDARPLAQLSDLPEKVYWPQLIKVFHSEGMAAQIAPTGIQITW